VDAISNADLTLEIVPDPDAPLDRISEFAATFDGYRHWGSFKKCAEIANAERHDSLTNLRSCLFFEWRRWHHFGDEPDAEAEDQWRHLVREIRRFVQEGNFA
jgi:hypothetical protein